MDPQATFDESDSRDAERRLETALEAGEPRLQPLVRHHVPRHQAAGAGAHAVALQRGRGGGAHGGRRRQAQVVIGGEVDQPRVPHAHLRALGRVERLQHAAEALRGQGLQVLARPAVRDV